MQKGDLISVEFTGKDPATGKVFDTTNGDVAKKEGLATGNKKYGPVVLMAGSGEILQGLDEQLLHMKVGETKNVTLEPANAFGERNPQLVRVVPLSEFKKNNVALSPGTIVNANDMIGKVQSVSGGRVRVDFNPDLAGKTVEYQLKIVKQFTDDKEKLDALVQKAFPAWEKPVVKHDKDHVELTVPIKQMNKVQRNVPGFAKLVMETVKGVKQVRVTTVFEAGDFKGTHVHDDGTMHEDDAH